MSAMRWCTLAPAPPRAAAPASSWGEAARLLPRLLLLLPPGLAMSCWRTGDSVGAQLPAGTVRPKATCRQGETGWCVGGSDSTPKGVRGGGGGGGVHNANWHGPHLDRRLDIRLGSCRAAARPRQALPRARAARLGARRRLAQRRGRRQQLPGRRGSAGAAGCWCGLCRLWAGRGWHCRRRCRRAFGAQADAAARARLLVPCAMCGGRLLLAPRRAEERLAHAQLTRRAEGRLPRARPLRLPVLPLPLLLRCLLQLLPLL